MGSSGLVVASGKKRTIRHGEIKLKGSWIGGRSNAEQPESGRPSGGGRRPEGGPGRLGVRGGSGDSGGLKLISN